MTKEEARKAAEIMLAYANGEEIESLCFGKYLPCEIPTFNWIDGEGLRNYRIKPKPKCRPFCAQEECWNEMHKHPDFGFIKSIGENVILQILRIWDNGLDFLNYTTNSCTFDGMFLFFTFTDGTPFGVKKDSYE